MKVLWVVNIPLPEVAEKLNIEKLNIGGWLVETSKYLGEDKSLELNIAFPHKGKYLKTKIKGVQYYTFKPRNNGSREYGRIEEILENVSPDIVHIHGTELIHSAIVAKLCKEKNIKTVVSLQGILYAIKEHIYSNLPFSTIYGRSLRNLIKRDSIDNYKRIYRERGKYERKTLNFVDYVIGRTTFDEACARQLNKNIKYYFCDESLRKSFYENKWVFDKCDKNTIFISQGHYSLKGIHNVIRALKIVKEENKEIRLYIGGNDIIKSNFLITYYGLYIRKLIKKNGLEKNIKFLGQLNENQIREQYLKAHIFIMASSIENSPNSLCEAMILGVPIISSYVGGIPDLLENNKEGFLYQHDAHYILADRINKLLRDKELCLEFSKKSRVRAVRRHDLEKNNKKLRDIYDDIYLDEVGNEKNINF